MKYKGLRLRRISAAAALFCIEQQAELPALILIGIREFYAGLFERLVLTDADVSVPVRVFPYAAKMGVRSSLIEMIGYVQKAEGILVFPAFRGLRPVPE